MAEKKVNVGNVPNLRFPGFEGEWKDHEIGDILTIASGKDYKHLDNGDVPVFGTGGQMTKVNNFLYNGETVFIGRKGTINKPRYFEGKFWTVDTLFYTHSFINVFPKFVFYIFENINWLNFNEASGVPSLSKSTIDSIEIKIPEIIEQKKISNILSIIDQRIQTQSKIIEDLKILSNSLAKKLFSKNLIFQNMEEGEWVTKQISEVLTIGSGRDYKHLKTGEVPVFGTGGLMTSVDQFLHDGETVCIGRKGTIDKPMYYNGKIWTVDTLFYTHSFKGVLPKFIFYAFRLINWKEYNEASGVPSLSKSTIEKIEIDIPSIIIQHKIVELLSLIDEKIENEKKVIDKMQKQKSFLLKSLFI